MTNGRGFDTFLSLGASWSSVRLNFVEISYFWNWLFDVPLCWLERALGKWSSSTIDFDLDVWHATSHPIKLHLTCQNVRSYYHISSHGPTSRKFEFISCLQILRNWHESFTNSWYHQFLLNICQTFYISNIRFFQISGLPIISMWRGEGKWQMGKATDLA